MKDKRQRMAMTWPYDPNVYAYLVNAALSQYPYAAAAAGNLPPHPNHAASLPPPPFNYYASAGLQRAAAGAYGPTPPFRIGGAGHPTGRPEIPAMLTASSNPLVRNVAIGGGNIIDGIGTQTSTPTHSGFYHIREQLRPVASIFGCGHVPGLCTGESRCACHAIYTGASSGFPGKVMAARPSTSSAMHMTSHKTDFSAATLFQPYKTDAERA